MILTKYGHACFTVEKEGKLLVVDPGAFSKDFVAKENTVGIVITHEHGDHIDTEILKSIVALNPDVVIYAHKDITDQLKDFKAEAVSEGQTIEVGPFTLEFFGGEHAVIHPLIPNVANLGVFIDDTLYYPGDSFSLPGKPVDVLALPISAPWLKMAEVIDFYLAVKPRLAFPTHDALLSDIGNGWADTNLPALGKEHGIKYERITGTVEL